MTDVALVLHELSHLAMHLDRVRKRRPATVDELRSDVDRLDALAMSGVVRTAAAGSNR